MSRYEPPARPKPYGGILPTQPVDPKPKPEPTPVAFQPIPRNELLDVLTWLRGEIYPGLVGHPLDDEGIAAWLCDNYVRYRQTIGHEDAKHRVFADIERVVTGGVVVTPGPGPAPNPGTFRRIEGTLRRVGRHFHDDRGYISLRGASCLYGLTDGVDPSALLDQYAAEGIQYVRVFAGELPRIVNGQDRGFQQTAQAARTRLPDFLAAASRRGLRVQVCAITDSALVAYDVYEHVRIVAQILAGTGHWFELGNEVEDGEQRRDLDFRRMVEIARSVGYTGLITVGAAASDELLQPGDKYPLGEIGDFASTHPWRGKEAHWMGDGCRLREGEMISATLGVPIAFGEPDNGSMQPDGYAFLIGALGAGFNGAVCYHSTPGRDVRTFELGELAKLRAFVEGHRLLEAGPWAFKNAQRPGNWPDSPVAAGSFEEGDPSPHMLPGGHLCRAFSFVRDGRGFVVPTGRRPNDPGAYRIGNGWREGAERGARVGVRVVEIAS